jgi:hypothetical protein
VSVVRSRTGICLGGMYIPLPLLGNGSVQTNECTRNNERFVGHVVSVGSV